MSHGLLLAFEVTVKLPGTLALSLGPGTWWFKEFAASVQLAVRLHEKLAVLSGLVPLPTHVPLPMVFRPACGYGRLKPGTV